MVLLSGAFLLYLSRRIYQFAQGYMGTARRRDLPYSNPRTAPGTLRQKRRFRTLIIVCLCVLLYWYYSDEKPLASIQVREEAGQAERWHGVPDTGEARGSADAAGQSLEETALKEEKEARQRGKLDLAAPKHRPSDDDEDAQVQHHNIPQPASDADQEPPCPHAALSSDFLIVIRTGATEAPQKLPVHFRTTLTCISSYIIYSDLSETITGHPVHDVLAHISESTRSRVPDFTHWRHLREHGRAGLDDAILYGSGPAGALENPGWKLDKFKFLPMTRAALDYRPDAKWYVFLEPDTYLSAQNLATYLANFDAEKPHYIGKHMFLDDVLFAHGGSGFVLSRPAMQKLAAHYSSHEEDLDAITEKSWAGDGVLAKALQQVDINLFVAWPHFQGDAVASLDFNISKLDRRPWCYAPATWHHMRADEVQALWGFETEWREKHGVDAVLRHRDVFAGMIKPNLSVRKPDWDNLSTDTEYSEFELAKLDSAVRDSMPDIAKVAHKSFENCRAVCANRQECIQFSYSNGKCSVSANVKLGYPATSQCLEYSNAAGGCVRRAEVDANGGHGVSSGWMMERVQKYIEDMDLGCQTPEGNEWVL